jgi:hypothetical protein
MTTERNRLDTTPVIVGGAGLVRWNVLCWLRAVERFGVQFRVVGDTLQNDPGLPPVAQEFVDTHADELRRLVLATPARVM